VQVSFPRSIAFTGSPPVPNVGVMLLINVPAMKNMNNFRRGISAGIRDCQDRVKISNPISFVKIAKMLHKIAGGLRIANVLNSYK